VFTILENIPFSLEKVLFGEAAMYGQTVRIAVALLGTAIATYFDIFNKRNIPNNFLYAFLAVALLVNFIYFDADLFIFSLVIAAFIGLFGFVFYKAGQMGGADVFVMLSITFLIPIHPDYLHMFVNFPFILSAFIFAIVIFSLYTVIFFGMKLMKTKAKPDKKYLLLLIPYAIFIYFYSALPFFSSFYLLLITIALLSSVFFLSFRDSINKMLASKLPLSKIEPEDVLALEMIDKKTVWKYKLQRVMTEKELKRMKKLGIKQVWVFSNLPPFLPFLFVGLIFALLFADVILG